MQIPTSSLLFVTYVRAKMRTAGPPAAAQVKCMELVMVVTMVVAKPAIALNGSKLVLVNMYTVLLLGA